MLKEFSHLVNIIKETKDQYMLNDLETLNDDMTAFGRYVEQVYYQNFSTPIKYATLEGEDLRNAIQQMDMSRRRKHEAAIVACSTINKTCDYYHVPHICPDTDDRYIIADFCAQVSAEFYLDGLGKSADTIDKVISAMSEAGISVKIHDTVNLDDIESALDEDEGEIDDDIAVSAEVCQKVDKEVDNAVNKTTDNRMLDERYIR